MKPLRNSRRRFFRRSACGLARLGETVAPVESFKDREILGALCRLWAGP